MHAIKGILDKGMKKIVTIFALLGTLLSAEAQNTLSLDSCRAMALRNNKQINVSRLKKDVAYNLRKSARTQYLPKVDAMGGYEWFSREISLLNKGQKSTLSNIGTDLSSGLSGGMNELLGQMVSQGQISPDAAQQLGQVLGLTAVLRLAISDLGLPSDRAVRSCRLISQTTGQCRCCSMWISAPC